jgi:hypothetical protein
LWRSTLLLLLLLNIVSSPGIDRLAGSLRQTEAAAMSRRLWCTDR